MTYRILAHRGWSGIAPENTLSAFKLALEDPTVDAIECDIQMTKDGEVVVVHDFTLGRTSNGSGLVKDYTLAELRQLDFGAWFSPHFQGEKIPTFHELLSLIDGKKRLVVELKTTANLYPELGKKLLEAIEDYPQETLMIESFNHGLMKQIKEQKPALCTGLILHDDVTLLLEQIKYTNSNFIAILFGNITQSIADALAAENIEIILWTLNQAWQYDYIKPLKGTFYLASDHPGLAMSEMGLYQHTGE